MADTNRNINGIDKAGQADLWVRTNPKASGGNPAATTGDSRPDVPNKSGSLPATKSLSDK